MPADDPRKTLALAALDADAAARDLLEQGAVQGRLSFAVLYRFATDPAFELSAEELRRLDADPAGQADLQRLIARDTRVHLPRQAAAASGRVERREAEQAVLTMIPSRADPQQVYLSVKMTDTEATPPTQLFVRRKDGTWRRLTLPEFAGGEVQMLLAADSDIAEAFAVPESEVYLR